MASNIIIIICSIFIVVLLNQLIEKKEFKKGEKLSYYTLIAIFLVLLSIQ